MHCLILYLNTSNKYKYLFYYHPLDISTVFTSVNIIIVGCHVILHDNYFLAVTCFLNNQFFKIILFRITMLILDTQLYYYYYYYNSLRIICNALPYSIP
jgi:hypothetical protein